MGGGAGSREVVHKRGYTPPRGAFLAGSSSICERINSEFAFIADRRRNRLAHARANKLVSCFHNLRLLKRMTKTNYTEPAVGWTEEDTTSGITKYGIVNYE